MANKRKPGLDRYSPEEIEAALAIVKRLEEARRKGGQASGRWGTPEQRKQRAKKAAEARWGKKPVENS